MKLLQTAVVFLGLLASAFAMSATFGIRYSFSRLVATQNVTAEPTYGVYHVKTVNFPIDGEVYDYDTLSYINVIDNFANNTGAYPELIAGGPGYAYATIRLTGQRYEGINSTINFWMQR